MSAVRRSILILEDDADVVRLLTHTLSTAGYRVVHAYGGEDALRKVRTNKPALILTDLSMPRMNGVEVIQKLKGDPETCRIPVIAVTAYVWEGIAQSAGQVGCDGFIGKPFNAEQLLREVEKHLLETDRVAADAGD